MNYLQIEFPIFVIALMANLTLLLIVVQYAPRNLSRYLFILFVLAQVFWITANYFAFALSVQSFLFVSRLTMFFAVFHSALFFLFIHYFLSTKNKLETKIILPLLVCACLVAALALFTPLIFSHLVADQSGKLTPQPGSLISIFGAFIGLCVGAGFYSAIKKYLRAEGVEKLQWRFLTWGLILTFILVLTFSFLNFIFFKNLSTVRFGHLYTLPFILFTAYAMIKHNLLNIKAVVAEIAVVILNILIFVQLLNSQSISQFAANGFTFVGTVIVGILLIRGVIKEVKQREELQILSQELAEANEKLKSLDLARAEFISIASHQLRTPPATVKWYLSAIINGDYAKVPSGLVEPLKKTQATNNHLISLIEDMLNVSRIERGKMEFLFELTDVEPLAKMAYEQLVPISLDKKLKLTYEPSSGLPKIMADKEKLQQVMNNLIDNALKYTKAGTVKVKIFQKDSEIWFQVQDSGKGISETDRNSIFQKYSRGKESIKQSAGLGLGLYVAKIIIEQHKGKIWAESQGEGKGSSFIFSLPINSGLKETTLVDLAQEQAKQV